MLNVVRLSVTAPLFGITVKHVKIAINNYKHQYSNYIKMGFRSKL